MIPVQIYDESFYTDKAMQCLNCSKMIYPGYTASPLPVHIQGGRKGVPMLFRYKKRRSKDG